MKKNKNDVCEVKLTINKLSNRDKNILFELIQKAHREIIEKECSNQTLENTFKNIKKYIQLNIFFVILGRYIDFYEKQKQNIEKFRENGKIKQNLANEYITLQLNAFLDENGFN